MKSLAATVSALLMTAAAGTAAAGPYDYGYNNSYNDGYGNSGYSYGDSGYRYESGPYGRGYYDYARVVNVDPIVQTVRRPVANQCDNGDSYGDRYDNRYDGYNNGYRNDGGYGYNNGYGNNGRYNNSGVNGGKLVGGLIGGALGNLVGKGDGRKAATIVGAVIGYNVAGASQRNGYGYDDRHYNRPYNSGYYDNGYSQNCGTAYRSIRQIVGYDVTYDYRGRIQHVRSATDPGSRIRVRVDVRPDV